MTLSFSMDLALFVREIRNREILLGILWTRGVAASSLRISEGAGIDGVGLVKRLAFMFPWSGLITFVTFSPCVNGACDKKSVSTTK